MPPPTMLEAGKGRQVTEGVKRVKGHAEVNFSIFIETSNLFSSCLCSFV